MSVKKKAIIAISICLIILVGSFVVDRFLSKSYLTEIKYKEVIKKIDNDESFVLVLSQTTCNHCASFKPKMQRVAKKHKLEVFYIEVDLLTDDERVEFKKYINFDGTPATIFIKNGEEKSIATRIDGDKKSDVIEKKLKSNGFID